MATRKVRITNPVSQAERFACDRDIHTTVYHFCRECP
jgi:hypothetical protein